MSNQQIAVTPQQDLHAIVANAPKDAELILASGKYILNRPLVVDKTIVMRSQTGKADDVMIGRNNATVLIVTDGKPTFHGILFFAPAKSDDAPVNTNEHDLIEYESVVAVREKGNATFIACKAASKQKNAFSARGKKARITLEKCWVPNSRYSGLFVDGQAEGLVKNSLIQNTGYDAVDVDEKGSVLTVENSTLANCKRFVLCAHNKGTLVVRNCKIDVKSTWGAYVYKEAKLEVKGSFFFSSESDDAPITLQSRYGVYLEDGVVELDDCTMSKLVVGAYLCSTGSKIKLKNVDMERGMLASIIYPKEVRSAIKISNCTLAEPTLDIMTFFKLSERTINSKETAKWDREHFSKDQLDRAYDLKTNYYEKILGSEFMLAIESPTPFYEEGGRLSLYYYLQSRYGGTFLLTKDLVSPDFSSPSCDDAYAYELAIASRAPFYYDAQGNPKPDYGKLVKTYERLYGVLTMAAGYIWEESVVDRRHTMEFPDGKNTLYFIFDLLDEPGTVEVDADMRDALETYALQSESGAFNQETPSLTEALDSYAESESEAGREARPRKFGVMVMIQLHKSELDYIRAHEGASKIFLAKLKEQGNWPFSDLSRPPIF